MGVIPRKMRRWLLAVGFGIALVPALGLPAWAAQEPADPAPISIRLSPAVLEVPYDPDGAEHMLRVDNTGSEALQVITEVSEFVVTEDGTTQFHGPDELSAAAWVSVDTLAFDLAPDERRDVAVTVAVPADAEPGERYVSVLFAVPATDADGNIEVTHRVAAKLYVEVPGDPIHHLEFGELTAPRLVDGGPAPFELTVHNRGNVHRRFQEAGRLVAISGSAEFPFENFTILGNSTRVVEGVWQDPPTFCVCTVEVEADDGRGNLLIASTRVLVFPLRLTLAILALGLGLGMLLTARRRRQADKLRHQLEQARQEGFKSAQQTRADV